MAGSITFKVITTEEQWRMYDRACLRVLSMSASSFSERWDAGEYVGHATPEMMEVLALRPHGR